MMDITGHVICEFIGENIGISGMFERFIMIFNYQSTVLNT